MNIFGRRQKAPATPPAPKIKRDVESLFSTGHNLAWEQDAFDFRAGIQARAMPKGQPVATMDSTIKEQFAYNAIGVPDVQFDWYSRQAFVGYQTCGILAQHWMISKACWMPARDAFRKGWNLSVNDGTKLPVGELARLRDLDKKYKIKNHLVNAAAFSRVFGIRMILPKIDSVDPDFYRKPFNPDAVTPGSYRGMVQIDPYWVSPMLDSDSSGNPASMHFYEPTYWVINGKPVHRSHLIICRPDEMADILKPSYYYGGLSVPQKIYERVYAAERTTNEAPQLAMAKRLIVFYTDIAKAVANASGFAKAMQFFSDCMNNWGVKVADKTADLIEQHDLSLADLDVVIMTQWQLVASIAEIPATKLLGVQPKGFNSSGEYEEASYHESLENIHDYVGEEILNRHYLLLERSEGLAYQIEYCWEELDSLTAAEAADIRLKNAQADVQLSQAGSIDGMDIRKRLSEDPSSGYSGIGEDVPEDVAPADPMPEGV